MKINVRSTLMEYLSKSVDCATTVANSSDKVNGSLIRVYDGSGNILVTDADSGTKFGKLTLRAEKTSYGIAIRAVRLAQTGTLKSDTTRDFVADSLTGKVITWQSDESKVLAENMALCGVKKPPEATTTCGSGFFCKVSDFNGKYLMITGPVAKLNPCSSTQCTASPPPPRDPYCTCDSVASGSYLYGGKLGCPNHMRAVAGGASCTTLPSVATRTSMPIANYSQPSLSYTEWAAECVSTGTPPSGVILDNQMYVICISL